MNFEELCEKVYLAFKEAGYSGIEGVGDAGDVWIFDPARECADELEYGLHPYVVDKKTYSVRCFDFFDEKDWELMRSARRIEVPISCLPNYLNKIN